MRIIGTEKRSLRTTKMIHVVDFNQYLRTATQKTTR